MKKENVIIGKLYKMGLLEFAERNDNLSVRVTFIDEASNEVLFVSDFRELGLEYMNYKHGGYARCADCDRLFKKTGNHSLYCKKCTGESFKPVKCIDCGKVFVVSKKNNRSCRCSDCQRFHRAMAKHEFYVNSRSEFVED